MAVSILARDSFIFVGVAFLCYSIFYQKKDARDIVVTITTVFVFLGFLTFLLYLVKRTWDRFKPASTMEREIPEIFLDEDRHTSTAKIQQDYYEQTQSYKERILKPREEVRRRKVEEEYYKFLGPAWKGQGEELGTSDDKSKGVKPKVKGGSALDAAEARTLPENVTQPPDPPPKPKTKKVLEIPEEPPEGSVGAVTVVLRTPHGRNHRRKFLITDSVQGLLNYMSSVGFHEKFYTLSTPYPRYDLGDHRDTTLGSVGINADTILNVEERDQ